MQRRFKINVDGRDYDVTVVEVSDDRQGLYPEPQIVAPEPAEPKAATPASGPSPHPEAGPDDVVCPIAGVVVSIDVSPGAEVTKGMPVVTLEAMKTKTIVSAGRAGKVGAIAVAVGDAVEPGQPLLTIV
ncbi:MAG: biotin/lipoyl-containing protein [Methyloligellaceae bacterium]